ncbi:hypothetical protein VP01_1186g1 [Puccinia sorghi]|uniref:Uncharacterized protein n=1 Tax=Puccinia sorghi TaxID=27349 RepID=A0A0L6VQW4_9BASI|nr:hypothetical protein VP01_1186g1 [Puccinia sorghi]
MPNYPHKNFKPSSLLTICNQFRFHRRSDFQVDSALVAENNQLTQFPARTYLAPLTRKKQLSFPATARNHRGGIVDAHMIGHPCPWWGRVCQQDNETRGEATIPTFFFVFGFKFSSFFWLFCRSDCGGIYGPAIRSPDLCPPRSKRGIATGALGSFQIRARPMDCGLCQDSRVTFFYSQPHQALQRCPHKLLCFPKSLDRAKKKLFLLCIVKNFRRLRGRVRDRVNRVTGSGCSGGKSRQLKIFIELPRRLTRPRWICLYVFEGFRIWGFCLGVDMYIFISFFYGLCWLARNCGGIKVIFGTRTQSLLDNSSTLALSIIATRNNGWQGQTGAAAWLLNVAVTDDMESIFRALVRLSGRQNINSLFPGCSVKILTHLVVFCSETKSGNSMRAGAGGRGGVVGGWQCGSFCIYLSIH